MPMFHNLYDHLASEERMQRAISRPQPPLDYAQYEVVGGPVQTPFTSNHLRGLAEAVQEFRE